MDANSVLSSSPADSSKLPPLPFDNSEFHIVQHKPLTIHTPLKSQKFVLDSDAILLDPSVIDSSFGDGAFGNMDSSDSLMGSASELTLEESGRTKSRIQLAGARRKIFFDPSKTKVAIITCGGVCPGLNNVIRALVNILRYRYGVAEIFGYRYGFLGLVPGKSERIHLTPEYVKDIHLFGGTILGTSRGPQSAAVMADFLINEHINILYCIGGDGTQKGAHAIATELQSRKQQQQSQQRPYAPISIIGIGKTIDNDLLFVDKSFGFETAVQLAQQAIIAAHEEARSQKNGIGIVKLMGRDSGAVALHAALSNGDCNMLLVPEVKFTIEKLVDYLAERFKTRDHCLIVCAEGAGQELLPDNGKRDASGNKVFGDVGEFLKREVSAELKKRGVEHCVKYIDPSYTIRGGAAIASDAVLCTQYAQMAAHAGMAGKTDMMVGLLHGQFVHLPLAKVTQGRKNVDIKGMYWQSFLDSTGCPFEN